MRLKIISNGLPAGTKVVNAETGEELKGVYKIEWRAPQYDKPCEATISLYMIPVELDVETNEPLRYVLMPKSE